MKAGSVKSSAQLPFWVHKKKKEKEGAEKEKSGDRFSHAEVRQSGQSQHNVACLQNQQGPSFEPLSAQDMLINGSRGEELSKVPSSHPYKIATTHRIDWMPAASLGI